MTVGPYKGRRPPALFWGVAGESLIYLMTNRPKVGTGYKCQPQGCLQMLLSGNLRLTGQSGHELPGQANEDPLWVAP